MRTVLSLLVLTLLFTASGRAAPDAHPMKIGIIGTGHIGGTLAKLWVAAGHEVLLSSRHPDELKPLAKQLGPRARVGTPREAASFGDVVLVSVPYKALPELGRDLKAELAGRSCWTPATPIRGATATWPARRARRGPGSRLPSSCPARAWSARSTPSTPAASPARRIASRRSWASRSRGTTPRPCGSRSAW